MSCPPLHFTILSPIFSQSKTTMRLSPLSSPHLCTTCFFLFFFLVEKTHGRLVQWVGVGAPWRRQNNVPGCSLWWCGRRVLRGIHPAVGSASHTTCLHFRLEPIFEFVRASSTPGFPLKWSKVPVFMGADCVCVCVCVCVVCVQCAWMHVNARCVWTGVCKTRYVHQTPCADLA